MTDKNKKLDEELENLMELAINAALFLIENDWQFIEEGDPALYTEILEIKDAWDSTQVQDALKAWEKKIE